MEKLPERHSSSPRSTPAFRSCCPDWLRTPNRSVQRLKGDRVMAQANSKRSGSYRARLWRLGTGVAVSLAMFTAGEVLAVDQSFYSFRDTRPNVPAGQGCGSYNRAGYINYCRLTVNRTIYINATGSRDSDLRSVSGGFRQDKYNDGFIIGNLSGTPTNTFQVTNNFSSTSIRIWTGTCYSGTRTTLAPGQAGFPDSAVPLRSMANASISSC